MKLIRDLQINECSRFFIPALVVLFVFSLSFHNHAIGQNVDLSVDPQDYASHSIEDCSACLLQGNLKPPEISFSLSNNYLGQLIATVSADFLIPHSFITLNTPSRAPPIS